MRALQPITILLFFSISSGCASHVSITETSASGFATNSTIGAASSLPKKAGQKNNQMAGTGQGGKSAVIDAMELIDPKASEQVLELIVKIAQHPATWKQIHRVLETLEANNAAYSQRIDGTRNELAWINKRVDRPGDKRNDVPDEQITVLSNATTSSTAAPILSLETTFQRWKDVLFASAVPKDLTVHPQLEVSATQFRNEPITKITQGLVSEQDLSPISFSQRVGQVGADGKKFDERLTEIENELKKLTKMSRMMPFRFKQLNTVAGQQKPKRFKSSTNNKSIPRTETDHHHHQNDSSPSAASRNHPKFVYHKVHNTTGQSATGNLLGPNFWKKIASLKHNGSNSTSRRNSFVAVSISSPPDQTEKSNGQEPLTAGHHQLMLATEPLKSTDSIKPCKKNHNQKKQKQRQPSRHAVGRHDDMS